MPGRKKSPTRGKKSPARVQCVNKRRMADSQEPTIEHNERSANKSHGWGTYDEQFRLRNAQRPQSCWAVINQDLWSFYITAMRDQDQNNDNKVFVGDEGQTTVWILGSSIPYWAGVTAASRPGDKNLNLKRIGVEVQWITKSGMKWKDLDSTFENEIKKRPTPNYIFVHLGAN
ncbi:unnamed protein product [Mytilus coruscus]|uniref:Uncharacterized protein n=1 Tax=Mytilus coruscus TaxID=42192 RepID=A0A6J8CFJ6_MYTCO|nr:unnamed protein product [Mytilus coruscus]